jgi:Glycosyl transferase family 2
MSKSTLQLTILMPCLNEAETLARCIRKAQLGLQGAGVTGEILIADNGSTDGSIQIAESLGARVVLVREKGYGSALRGGIEAAAGQWIIMGDSDDSYDFSDITGFVQKFRDGYDLVMGCRMPRGGGTIMPGAMPWKNRWIGNPVLSFVGRLLFKGPAHDFHCGLRGFTREGYTRMALQTTGMEFASEMVISAILKGLRITEVPITLHPDGRSRPPHLKPWRDGWRHLRFMLIYSPRWLFLIPGLLLTVAGGLVGGVLTTGGLAWGTVKFEAGTLMMAGMAAIVGVQTVAFAFFTKVFAISEGLLPDDPKFSRLFGFFSLEKGLAAGVALFFAGLAVIGHSVWLWRATEYGELPYADNLRRLIPAATLVVLGIQVIFSSFFLSVLGLHTRNRRPPRLPGGASCI